MSETFSDWLVEELKTPERHRQHMGLAVWDHQQKKIAERDAKILELEEKLESIHEKTGGKL
tara:strand:+ start:471 stop:653 length:183 start_codon:yes stop_codon:yes gene_type:complete